MFWINKRNRRKRRRGHEIVNSFLKESWNEQEGKYVNCDYASFKRDRRMENLLYKEQGGFCCYCMRHLFIGKHTSLEHVLPHHCRTKQGGSDYETNNYYKRFIKPLSNVSYVHLNGSKVKWHVGPPYPHFCAYENLVLSCDGSLFVDEDRRNNIYPSRLHLCCNEYRGNKLIVPLFFFSNVEKLIEYKDDGRMSVSNNVRSPQRQIELSNTIEQLNLENEKLRIIRQVWCLIASSQLYHVADVRNAAQDNVMRTIILADCGVPVHLQKRVNQPIYWSLLCEYYWFYGYFADKKGR